MLHEAPCSAAAVLHEVEVELVVFVCRTHIAALFHEGGGIDERKMRVALYVRPHLGELETVGAIGVLQAIHARGRAGDLR